MSESFAELLEESFANQKIKPGAILTGTVVGVNQDVVIVNAGLKSEAVISADQFFNERGELEVQVGDTVEVALGTSDWQAFPLRGSWFIEAFEGPMSNLQRFVAGEDDILITNVDDAIRTMALVEACYDSSSRPATSIPEL